MVNFDWRLSIATVAEDGIFSDFSGYLRNLILISGKGISLKRSQNGIGSSPAISVVDHLDKLLSFSTFDGACKTEAKLIDGTITDFNLMHDPKKYQATLETYWPKQSVNLQNCDFCFIYSLADDVMLKSTDSLVNISLKVGYLLKITQGISTQSELENLRVSGEKLIIIYLNSLA
jgi:environmental stress-induced protein Ves